MENFSLKQLQAKCTELGLKAYGTKATMIERIKTELNKRDVEEAMTIENALQGKENESNMSPLKLNVSNTEDDQGELVDLLNSINEEIRETTTTSIETTYEEEEKSTNKKRKAVKTYFHLQSKHTTHAEALSFISSEYHLDRMSDTREGQKE